MARVTKGYTGHFVTESNPLNTLGETGVETLVRDLFERYPHTDTEREQ